MNSTRTHALCSGEKSPMPNEYAQLTNRRGARGPLERSCVAEPFQADARRKHVQASTDLGQQLQSAVVHRKRAGP